MKQDEPFVGVTVAQHALRHQVYGTARGRGAASNISGRFETEAREDFDDGWDSLADLPALKTDVQLEQAKKIITRNSSPDISFDRSINPYGGCEHGCSYCFARPTHAYHGLSAGLDFETKLFAKPNAAELLERELGAKGYRVRTIALGTNTDPYQPIEREHCITRQVLEVLARTHHPVGIVTKSALVLRDLDILAPMAAKGLVKVALSVTTLNGKLARTMEPRASAPYKRLEAVQTLSETGVPVTVMVAPIIPALNDDEIEVIVEQAAAHGACDIGYVLLRLPHEVAPLFREWLLRHYPNRYRHVLSVLRTMRGGKDYDANWGQRMRGTGPYAQQIARRMSLVTKRHNLGQKRKPLRSDLFCPPASSCGVQMSLF